MEYIHQQCGGKTVFAFTCEGGVSTQRVSVTTGYILPKNKVLTIYVVTGGIAVRYGLGITFHASE